MEAHGGSVINIASVGGMRYGGMIGIYDTTKAALIHLTRHLAVELAPTVRVNAIAPGLVKTDFAKALYESGEEAVAAAMPLKRLGVPEDIGPAAVYLASDAASWVTGNVLVLDGGLLVGGT
jgi:3-oxoacyl-[acyl-carrier protein] reductase